MWLPTTSAGQELLLRSRRVIFDVSVAGATPSASVQQSTDVPGGCFVQTQGVDQVTAQDSGANFSGIANNSSGASTLGVLVSGPKALGGLVQKLYSVSVSEITSTAGTVSKTLAGASTTGITASGNIAFTVTGTAANLDTDTVTYRCTVECEIQQHQD